MKRSDCRAVKYIFRLQSKLAEQGLWFGSYFGFSNEWHARCQWSTKNYHFKDWFNSTLKNNTIRCNNCFGSKKRSTTLIQANTCKHECRNVTATFKVLFNNPKYYSITHWSLLTLVVLNKTISTNLCKGNNYIIMSNG